MAPKHRRQRSWRRIALGAMLCAWMGGHAGCQNGGDQLDESGAPVTAEMAPDDESANAGSMSASRRIRNLPTVDARTAARQVALMPAPTDQDAAARIALLAEVYRLAIESDDGMSRRYLLVAGAGVEFDSIDMDAHEFALRALAPLGAIDVSTAADRPGRVHVAWASEDVQHAARHRQDRSSAATRPGRTMFPGTREPASVVVVSWNSPRDAVRLRGTITIESPDGRITRQGFEAMRRGSRWTDVQFTGVRVEW